MAVDVAEVSKLDVEPGTLPETMAAWVIRQEREGEPKDAFQIEEIEVPEPGAFEVIVRVMAAGVNFNNVWAALGKPVSVFGYGDHPEYGHHIGGSDASGIVWKVGDGRHQLEARRRGRRSTATRPPTRTSRSTASTRWPRPSQEIWGYETTWGSFAQFTKVQAQQLLPKPQNLSWVDSSAYGLTYFTAYRMLMNRCKHPGRPQRADLGRGRRARRVRRRSSARRRARTPSASSPPTRRASWSSSSAPSTTSTATSSAA